MSQLTSDSQRSDSPERPGISVAALGDVMMAREVGRHFQAAPGDFAMPDIGRLVRDADVVLANLENPVATGGRPDPRQNPNVTFRAAPETLSVLKNLGVDAVTLGNNHALDYGEEALLETLEHLDEVGIGWAGAGRNYEEANRPLLLDRRGQRIAILSRCFIYSVNTQMATRTQAGIADHRLERIVAQIRELDSAGYLVIVSAHWGFEYRLYPLPYQMRMARRMIDEGARLVLGHGPHYPQGIERWRDRDIVYSLGNFIFDEPFPMANRSFVYTGEIYDRGATANRRVSPVRIREHVPQLIDGAQGRRLECLVTELGTAYERSSRRFWRQHSTAYLVELLGRSKRGRSLKYLRVPPRSFYTDVSPREFLEMRLRRHRIGWMSRRRGRA